MKKAFLWIGGILVVLIAAAGIWLGPTAYNFWKSGFFEKHEKHAYTGTKVDRLRALHTALMLYSESEEGLPPADKWMDLALLRSKTADLEEGEAIKKFVSPGVTGEGQFGFGYNDAMSGLYPADIADPAEAMLVFDSKDLAWNAHGDPEALKPEPARPDGNLGITVEGSISPLK